MTTGALLYGQCLGTPAQIAGAFTKNFPLLSASIPAQQTVSIEFLTNVSATLTSLTYTTVNKAIINGSPVNTTRSAQTVALIACDTDDFDDWYSFNLTAFEIAFSGYITLWAIGLGIGLFVATVRKMKSPIR